MSTNKEKRILSKVKKVRAFLNVARLNEEDKKMNLTTKKRPADGDVFEESPKKQKNSENVIDMKRDITELPFQMLTDEERIQLIELKKASKMAAMERSKIYLTLKELGDELKKRLSKMSANPDECEVEKLPTLYAQDLQSLILYAIEGANSSYYPRWCRLLRPNKISSIVVMVIDGVSLSDVNKNTDCFDYLTSHIPQYVEMKSPCSYNSTVENEVFKVRLSESQWHHKVRSGSVNEIQTNGEQERLLSDVVPTDTTDKFDRRLLLLNLKDMLHDGFPLPIVKNGQCVYPNFKFTKERYTPVTANSPIFSVDCEMTILQGNAIIDYATRFSGITEEMLRNVKTRLVDVQREFSNLLPPDAILVGHSLDNDLIVLKMFHPYCIDTSVIYNLGKKDYKSGLSTLTRCFLKKNIQLDVSGHSPIEDSIATMELTLLKLRTGVEFGDMLSGCAMTTNNITQPSLPPNSSSSSASLPSTDTTHFQSLFQISTKAKKQSVVISSGEIVKMPVVTKTTILAQSDQDCVKQAVKEFNSDKQFIWLNLQDCLQNKAKLKSVAYRKEKFEELDASIKEIKESCRPGSLFITVFSGKVRKKKSESAGVYVCIT
ncbi:hypothetical protein LOTGIDRAFT_229335 [Lottia gigantea]|uniref:Exonuclease domain-containing protein n=1 Tax=Lottia gigantea TaxID=225164 RepID=V3ZS55_LOTGI|nr:hypothetical protein LOTGIDRAFT_229335 [Lottia gigantea]ESO87197.1 hypothetical protein LOTGIDRAFT_229335 [Lottia gigantea]